MDLGFEKICDAASIEGDPVLLREALNNLIDNALRYSLDGEQITVRISRTEEQTASQGITLALPASVTDTLLNPAPNRLAVTQPLSIHSLRVR